MDQSGRKSDLLLTVNDGTEYLIYAQSEQYFL
jgi:hypothetical protein